MSIRTKAGLISKKIEGNPTVEKTNTDKKNSENQQVVLMQKGADKAPFFPYRHHSKKLYLLEDG